MVAKYSGKLRVEMDGVTSALLVLNNTTGEGILVNSEGSAYSRYSAYLPFAKPYLDYEIARIADYCVSEGAENTSDGLWAITFDEVCEHFNIDLSDDSEIRDDLLDILRTREEIAEIVATEDEFEIKYSMDICPPVPVAVTGRCISPKAVLASYTNSKSNRPATSDTRKGFGWTPVSSLRTSTARISACMRQRESALKYRPNTG